MQAVEAKDVRCSFCGGTRCNPVIHENGHDAYRCEACGLIFVWPLPSPESVAELYREDRAHLSAESHLTGAGSRIGRVYACHAVRLVRRYAQAGTFVEVGAGNGNVLVEAKAAGFTPYGVELNPIQAGFIRDRLHIPCAASLEEVRTLADGGPADVVYHSDVLSHFFDPFEEFRAINAALAPGGLHVFETGNLGDVEPGYFGLFQRFQLPDHLFFFSDRNLDELLERTGFERIATHRYSLVPQLRLTSSLRALRARARGRRAAEDDGAPATSAAPAAGGSALWTLFEYLVFGLRYKLGAVARKSGRPQTVVVVARKRAEA